MFEFFDLKGILADFLAATHFHFDYGLYFKYEM